MPFEKGNKLGKKFSGEIQPETNPGRPKGSVSRSTIARKVLSMVGVMPDELYEKVKLIYPGIEKRMSFEDMITLVQAKKALIDEDNQSYKLLVDSAYGAPKQEMDMVGEIKITDHRIAVEIVKPIEED